MIYFIGGMKHREFKYFELIEKIRKSNQGITESFFDVDIKEEDKFLEKISFNSIFSTNELIVLKRAEKLKDLEKILDYMGTLDINNKEIIIDYFKEDGKIGVKLSKKLETMKKEGKMEVHLFPKEDDKEIRKYIKNEVEKIKIYLNGEKININEIKKIISVEKEYQIYECTEKIFTKKASEVIEYLERTKDYMAVLYALYNEIEIMYKLSSLIKSGVSLTNNYNIFKMEFEQIKDIFKSNNRIPNPYSILKKMERLKNYSNKSLKNLVYRCWEMEKDIKTGKIEQESAIETLIMEIENLYGKK